MAANELTNLDGNFKEQFHSKVEELVPQVALLQRGLVDWVPAEKMNGEFYAVPTLLRSNQGVTYLGEGGTLTALSSAKPGQMKEAQVKGSEINVRGQLTYKALSQASSTGPKAFKKAISWLVEDLANVAYTRIEIAALYGRSGLGIVESVTDLTGGLANIVITEATFAPGIWVPLEGATIDSFTTTTKNNTGTLTISLVTTSTRTIKVVYTGTIANDCAAADVLYFEGAYGGTTTWYEMVGLKSQCTAVTGTMFAIDRAAYSLVQGNESTSTGKPSKAKIVAAAMLAVDKGCMSDLVVLVSTKTWATLLADEMALRSFDQSYSSSQSKSGSREIVWESLNGQLKIVCHPMVKYGDIFLFNPDDLLWVGSSKPTFEIPGMAEKFFRVIDGYNGVELQNYSDLAIYALKPSQTVVMTGCTP